MQASLYHRSRSNMSNKVYYQHPLHIETPHSLPQMWLQSFDYNPSYINTFAIDENGQFLMDSQDQYCTLESSSVSHKESHLLLSHSTETSNGSPSNISCITEEMNDFRHKLKELENVMFGPDEDCFNGSLASTEILDSWRLEAIPRNDLKQVLVACAKSLSNYDFRAAESFMSDLRQMVSVSGKPLQRLGAYMLEGLVAKVNASGSSIYKSLRYNEPASFELLSHLHVLYETCPYFKFGYMSANGAIAEAMKEEDKIHIIDFKIGQGSQWISLLRAFASRPKGPPSIRITGIDDVASAYARGGGLNIVGKRLSKLAKTLKVPLEFRSVAVSGWDVQVKHLGIRPNEAVAVNFAFMLHRIPDESVTGENENHRDRLLKMVKGLNPKVVTIVEQELDSNTASFYPRFIDALEYYEAVFESIDSTLPREHKARIDIEQHCLARDIVNIIACEGTERVERHEPLGKWRLRFGMAGFSQSLLSSPVNATIKTLLESYNTKYSIEERDGVLYLGWMNRDLIASCAWK